MAHAPGGSSVLQERDAPWIAVMVVQWIVIVVLALVQIGIFRRLLPILERTTDGDRPSRRSRCRRWFPEDGVCLS